MPTEKHIDDRDPSDHDGSIDDECVCVYSVWVGHHCHTCGIERVRQAPAPQLYGVGMSGVMNACW